MGLTETDSGIAARVATDLGEITCAGGGGVPTRAYVLVSADVRKGTSKEGSYVSVRNGKVVRVLGPSDSIETLFADKAKAA